MDEKELVSYTFVDVCITVAGAAVIGVASAALLGVM